MATIVHDSLIVCHDCGCLLANGENGEDSHTLTAFETGMTKWAGYHLVLACPGEDSDECESQPWYHCAVCDVHTFGWGHPTVTFGVAP